MTGYEMLFIMVKDALEKEDDYIDSSETYLIGFSQSYDNKEWNIEHTMLMGCGSNDKFDWENDFDEGQRYYRLHYVVKLSDMWYRLDMKYYKAMMELEKKKKRGENNE